MKNFFELAKILTAQNNVIQYVLKVWDSTESC